MDLLAGSGTVSDSLAAAAFVKFYFLDETSRTRSQRTEFYEKNVVESDTKRHRTINFIDFAAVEVNCFCIQR